MNELATISAEDNPFKLALLSPKVVEMKKAEAMKEINALLHVTFNEVGFALKDMPLLCTQVYKEIQMQFRFIRLEEMKLAFQRGIRKEYGEYMGLSLITFHTWMKAFIQDGERKQAIEELRASREQEPKPLMSKTEAEFLWKQAMREQFAHFKKTGFLKCELPIFQFKEFERLGLIKLNATEKQFIWNQAKENLLEKKRLKRLNPDSKEQLTKLTESIGRIVENKMTSIEQGEVKCEACRISITNHYKSVEGLSI